jgi:hypothetical protein
MCSHSFTPTRRDRVLGTPTSMEWLRRVLLFPLHHQEKCFIATNHMGRTTEAQVPDLDGVGAASYLNAPESVREALVRELRMWHPQIRCTFSKLYFRASVFTHPRPKGWSYTWV